MQTNNRRAYLIHTGVGYTQNNKFMELFNSLQNRVPIQGQTDWYLGYSTHSVEDWYSVIKNDVSTFIFPVDINVMSSVTTLPSYLSNFISQLKAA